MEMLNRYCITVQTSYGFSKLQKCSVSYYNNTLPYINICCFHFQMMNLGIRISQHIMNMFNWIQTYT